MDHGWIATFADEDPGCLLASGYDADDLGIGGKPAKRLLGAGYTIVDADLKDAPTGAPQYHLRIWSDLADEVCRLTGARFIVSLTAVLDFDMHWLSSFVGEAVVVAQGATSVSPGAACRWGATSRRGLSAPPGEQGNRFFKYKHAMRGVPRDALGPFDVSMCIRFSKVRREIRRSAPRPGAALKTTPLTIPRRT